jgi:DNA-directed RNA polymerase III subunit RPC6
MPPRKRPAPPPEEPSASSKPLLDAQPSEPSKSAPDSEQPTISATILAQLPTQERLAYKLIFEAGNKGMWMLDIRKKLLMGPNIATKVVRSLVGRRLLKEVSDVRHRSRKIFMATDFQPSAEITGGTWYHDGRLDTDAVTTARRCCQAQVERLGAATAQMIHHGILKDDPRAGYTIDKIRDIIKTMVLDKVLEEVKSTGTGEFTAVRAGTMCYRLVTGAPQGGMMEGIPCGVCPRIDECSPEGVISPSTCVYYYKWLQMDF